MGHLAKYFHFGKGHIGPAAVPMTGKRERREEEETHDREEPRRENERGGRLVSRQQAVWVESRTVCPG